MQLQRPKAMGARAQVWLVLSEASALPTSTEDSPPEGIPGWSIPFRIDRMNCRFAKSSFAVLDDGFELWERHQFKRFHSVLFFSGSCGAAPPLPWVYDLFQCIRFPMKSAEPSAQALSAALKMILFRRFNMVTSALSLVPRAGKNESLDCAAMTVVAFAWRIT